MKEKIKTIDEYTFKETVFNSRELAKTETIMALGNGYLGLRSSAEESYTGQCRGMFIAGSFNKFDADEVTELPNCADLMGTDIWLEEEMIDFSRGTVSRYGKNLDLRKGLLTRKAYWSINGRKYSLAYERFVSQSDLHLIGQKITISPDSDVSVRILTGINGRMTNSGSQHFTEGEKRYYDRKYLQLTTRTTQSQIHVFYTLGMRFVVDGKEIAAEPEIIMDRRRILAAVSIELKAFQTLTIEKIVDVRMDRDMENAGLSPAEVGAGALDSLKANMAKGYEELLAQSIDMLDRKLWSKAPVKITGTGCFDQLAIHFAQYHMHSMTPAHDSRMNIGAKGLSGEGYKGHTFWDTEIFALPCFIFSNPETARKLVEYRYLTLQGARRKAGENGYEGAQFPWESAWLKDGEVTPEWGSVDVTTGLPLKIESGLIEQHITGDVAYGIWQYYMATGDEQFMLDYGYEVLFDTAKFWVSRLELSKEDGLYHITDVMGPDEFKEHVDDNAYTNYLAWWNIRTAIRCYDKLKEQQGDTLDRLCRQLHLEEGIVKFRHKADRMYLPVPGKDGVLPQDSTYLTLQDIDLDKYKRGKYGSLYKDYSSEQISRIQVSKQADVLLLFLLMEELFPADVKKASWEYYEPRTLHDSSLSFSTHAILACDMEEEELAYSFFKRACRIDLGTDMFSCNDGIHAAAAAGIWQAAIFGFAGVRMLEGKLRIIPHLPHTWKSMEFVIYWQGQRLVVSIDAGKVVIENTANAVPMDIYVVDESLHFDGSGRSSCIRKERGVN